jgi:GNAT superfamily N-acetyltransferase
VDSLTLRAADQGDSEFAFTARRAALKQYVDAMAGWDEAEQRELHGRRFASQDFRVISFAGVDVGIIAVSLTPDHMKINQLLLVPERQGRRIGRQCMLRMMDEAAALGLPIRLRVMKVNPRALSFYERLGFIRTAATDSHDLLEWRPPASSVEQTATEEGQRR